jgi:hypothetical protein
VEVAVGLAVVVDVAVSATVVSVGVGDCSWATTFPGEPGVKAIVVTAAANAAKSPMSRGMREHLRI